MSPVRPRPWRLDYFDETGEPIGRASVFPYLTNAASGLCARLEHHGDVHAVVVSKAGRPFALAQRAGHRTVALSGYTDDGTDLTARQGAALGHLENLLRMGISLHRDVTWTAVRRRPVRHA